jgi:hypothetical protein
MEAIDDVLEDSNQPQGTVPSIVKTLAIFVYVGNGLLILLFLFVLAMLETFMNEFANKMPTADMSTDMFMNIMLAACVIVVIFCIACVVGVFQMTKGKRWGFYLYAVFNGLWVIMQIMGGTPQNFAMAAISLGFLIGLGAQLKHLPK